MLGNLLHPTDTVKNLGVCFDATMGFPSPTMYIISARAALFKCGIQDVVKPFLFHGREQIHWFVAVWIIDKENYVQTNKYGNSGDFKGSNSYCGTDGTHRKGSEESVSTVESRGQWAHQMEFILSCVGYAVGVGNIWRFPYLCMRNGGGAFLIPYFISLCLCGIPLYFLELVIGQFSGLGALHVWAICPLFKGLGYAMVVVSSIMTTYYNTILTWAIYYLIKSCSQQLPWSTCGNAWNTPRCLEYTRMGNISYLNQSQARSSGIWSNSTEFAGPSESHLNLSGYEKIPWTSPSEEYWHRSVLELSDGIGTLGGVRWEIYGCFALAWLISFLCLCKGVKSLGKVVYVTATLPYILLTILLIRGVMLPGAADGIKYYLIPDWNKLLDIKVWGEACLQIFYSLGPAWGGLITMSSFNRFDNNCLRDSILVPIINCGTSFYGGFVIFSVIGFMAHKAQQDIKDVITSGPGLAFIVYPEAVSNLPISPMWAILFFIMLLSVGVDSQFGMLETMVSSFIDSFPEVLRKHKVIFTGLVCMAEVAIGIIFCTRAGLYYFQVIDWYTGAFTVMLIAVFECIVLTWIYGADRLYYDISLMLGHKPSIGWKICWCYVSPTILLLSTVYNLVAITAPYYGDYHYPAAAIGVGWLIAGISFIPIPLCAVIELTRHQGTFMQRLKKSLQPTVEWGPADGKHRAAYKYKEEPTSEHTLPLAALDKH